MHRRRGKDGWTWFLDRSGCKVFYADARFLCFGSCDYADDTSAPPDALRLLCQG